MSIIFGLLVKLNIINWTLPHPIYLDYSLQYFYLSIIALIFVNLNSKFFRNTYIFIFSILILIKFYSLKNNFLDYEKIVSTEKKYINTNLVMRHFWEKNKKIFLHPKYINKSFLIDLPHKQSDWTNYLGVSDYDAMIFYNNEFQHSLTWNEFFDSKIRVNIGHSLLLGVNNFYAFNPELEASSKNTVRRFGLKNNINDLPKFDFILSDINLEYELYEKIDFKNFNIFIYKYPNEKYNQIKSYQKPTNYNLDKEKFDRVVFSNHILNNSKKINNICDWNYLNNNNYHLKIKINATNKCLMIFPITYSKTNLFKINDTILDTFRVQHYFHGAFLSNNDVITISKKSLIKYAFFSFVDYLDAKKFLNEKES